MKYASPPPIRIYVESIRWLVVATSGMAIIWILIGLNLYRHMVPVWDEVGYIKFAQYLHNWKLQDFVADRAGTLDRPYGYPMYLAATTVPFSSLLVPEKSRILISVIQLATYFICVVVTIRSICSRDQRVGDAMLVALVMAPFPIFSQLDILSESVSISLFCLLVLTAVRPIRLGSHFNVALQFVPFMLILSLFGVMRAAHLPVFVIVVVYHSIVILRRFFADFDAERRRWLLVAWANSALASGVVLGVQAGLLYGHSMLVPNDPKLYGVGLFQLESGVTIVKYATSNLACPGIPAAIQYNNPLHFEKLHSWSDYLLWYLAGPITALLHIFQSINHDFPTTYITTLNPWIVIPFNFISVFCVALGLVTLFLFRAEFLRALIVNWSRADSFILAIPIIPLVLLLQASVLYVETRFGIIPWISLAAVGAWGTHRWMGEFGTGKRRWAPVIAVTMLTAALFLLSRLMVAWSPALTRAYAQGC